MNNEREYLRQAMKSSFEAGLENRLDRALRTKIHVIIPYHYFSAASSECRQMFLDGHFYGCISLAQALAEALSRFIANTNNVKKIGKSLETRVEKLEKQGTITPKASTAYKILYGNDRNTFHHLNENLETDYLALEARAEECVNALFDIESEIFAFDVNNGTIVPKNPKYWPQTGPNTGSVFIRASQ